MSMSEEETLQNTISILLGNIKFNYYKMFMYHPVFYVLLRTVNGTCFSFVTNFAL